MTDTVLVAIHEVEIGPQNNRQIVKPGSRFPADIEVDVDLEAELVRAGAVRREPVKATARQDVSVETDADTPAWRSRKSNRFKKVLD